jgi:hypothetical protein
MLKVSVEALTDGLCWESLTQADTAAFTRQAAISADLSHFAVCACFLDDE